MLSSNRIMANPFIGKIALGLAHLEPVVNVAVAKVPPIPLGDFLLDCAAVFSRPRYKVAICDIVGVWLDFDAAPAHRVLDYATCARFHMCVECVFYVTHGYSPNG